VGFEQQNGSNEVSVVVREEHQAGFGNAKYCKKWDDKHRLCSCICRQYHNTAALAPGMAQLPVLILGLLAYFMDSLRD